MARCLIVSSSAEEFAQEIARTPGVSIPVEVCVTADAALQKYSDQAVILGDPDMVAAILPELPLVRWVQSTWAGITPLTALDRRDFVLTGVKDVFGAQISEYVIGYLLAHELKVIERLDRQRAHEWSETPSGMLSGKRLGIMGTGSIGSHIARTARAFDLRVTGLNSSGTLNTCFDDVYAIADLYRFLEGLDYLVTTLPQTEATDHLLDRAALAKLPAGAYVINVGRGNVIEDTALIDALQAGTLAGATLDVFDEEPIPADSPLWDTPNLMITAHIAALSHPSLIVPIFVDNYRRYASDEPLQHIIDLDRGY